MKLRLGACLTVCLAAWGWLSAGVNRWTTGGPYGGQIYFITVDPQTPNVLYAGVEDGGFFKSRNWGQSWEEVAGFSSMSACLVHPLDHRRVIVCGNSGISRSTDAGDSWQNVWPHPCKAISADTLKPNTLYAGYTGAFYRSTDRGDHWVQTADLSGIQIDVVSQLPTAPGTLFIGTWGHGVMKSTDGGFSWTNVTLPWPDVTYCGYRVACHPDRPGWVYASSSCNFICRSTNGGSTWTQLTVQNWFNNMVFDPVETDRVYFINLNDAYLSTDGGATMSPIFPLGGRSLALDRSSGDGALYLGTLNGIRRSFDRGGTFRDASCGILSYTWALATSPTDPGTVYAGDDTGNLFRSRDDGNSWTHLGKVESSMFFQGLTITTATSPPTFFGTANGDLFKSTNGGADWSLVLGGKYLWDVKTDPTNPLRLYASSGWRGFTYDFAGIFTSTDGGTTWNQTNHLDNLNITELLIDPRVPRQLYAAGDSGLFKSTNYGASWVSATSGLTDTKVYSLAFDSSSPPFLFAGTSSAGVFRSSNGGAGWGHTGLIGGAIQALGCEPVSNTLYAGGWPELDQSTDHGASWQVSSPDLTWLEVKDIATDSRGVQRVYAATRKGVYAHTATAVPTVAVQARYTQTGIVNKTLSNQVLPATALTLLFAENNYPAAGPDTPLILELKLPAGAVLSQTLATGELADTAVQPAGRMVIPLAVSEYAFDAKSATYEPVAGGGTSAGIDANAVQLFRSVAGEDKIWLRLTQSTSPWHPSTAERVLGVTLGAGAGVWPPDDGSNWGASGRFRQENTQFFGDLRGYDFAAQQGAFPVTLRAFFQKTGVAASTTFSQNPVSLFQLDLDRSDAYANSILYGAELTDSAVADLNQDGREDLISIDRNLRRLYWALQQADGAFGAPQRRALAGDAPVTVDAADVNGDGVPEILVSDAGGHLTVYSWAALSQKSASPGATLVPLRVAALAGVASASLIADVNQDGNTDFLYTDGTANTLNILYGQSFTSQTSLATGAGPVAVATGDVDGDADLDVAVANRDGNSVTVFRNQGGSFTSTTYAAGGQPVAVALADFGRDGRADLVIGLADQKAIAAWTALAGGTFNPGQALWIYFLNPPSALQADNFDGLYGPDVLIGFADYYKLALCASDAAGALHYAFNINTLGDMELDPVNHVTLTEDNILNVASGTSIGGVCSRAGVAALAQQPFNLVHLPRSANMSFSIVNLGTQSAMLNLELYNDTGSLVRSVSRPIAPRELYDRNLTDPALFGSDAAAANRWARAFLTGEQTSGTWLAAESSGMEHLEGLKLPDPRDVRSRFILPAGTDPLRQVLLVNPSKEQAQLTVQRLGGGGVKQTLSYLLPGRGRRVLDLSTVMPALAAEDYLLVSADRPIAGCQLWGDANKQAALNGLPADETVAPLYGPHVVWGNFGVLYTSNLTLINASASAATIRLDLVDDCGSVAATTTAPLAGLSKVNLDAAGLFGLTGPFTGYVVVDPQGAAGVTGCVTFGQTGSLSSLPLERPVTDWFLAGKLASGTVGGTPYYTAFFILNPAADPQVMQLTAHDINGLLLDTKTVTVPGHGRKVVLLDQLMPGLGAILGGYMIIQNQAASPSNLLAFSLSGEGAFHLQSVLRVTYPNGGETLLRGQACTITWVPGDCHSTVKIELYKGNAFLQTITGSTPNSGSFPWTIPAGLASGADYRVRVTDPSAGAWDESDTAFTVAGLPCQVTLAAPNGGEELTQGQASAIAWSAAGGGCGATVRIDLYKGGALNRTIAGSTAAAGSFGWTVPADQTPGGDYTVRVTDLTSGSYDESDANFIISAAPQCTVTLQYPNGGEMWNRGTQVAITWNRAGIGCGTSVKVDLYKGGALDQTIAGSIPGSGPCNWTVPADQALGDDYKVRVTDLTSGSYGESNFNFTISASWIGNFTIGGYLGVGTQNPLRAVHVAGGNAVFRIDRNQNTSALLMIRTTRRDQVWKTFVIGANASGLNDGAFVINDLGTAVTGPGTNRLTIANDGTAAFGGTVSATGFFTRSGRALKTDVRPLDHALDTVLKLQAVRFHWRETSVSSLGFIAEDVAATGPETVSRQPGGGVFGLDYGRLTALLVEGLKRQQQEIESLRQQRDRLKTLLEELRRLEKQRSNQKQN